MSEKIGVALWSSGPTRTEEQLRQSLETVAGIGLKGVQPWCVGDCVLDPDRCTGSQRRAMREIRYDGWYAIEDETGKDIINSLQEGKRFWKRR